MIPFSKEPAKVLTSLVSIFHFWYNLQILVHFNKTKTSWNTICPLTFETFMQPLELDGFFFKKHFLWELKLNSSFYKYCHFFRIIIFLALHQGFELSLHRTDSSKSRNGFYKSGKFKSLVKNLKNTRFRKKLKSTYRLR